MPTPRLKPDTAPIDTSGNPVSTVLGVMQNLTVTNGWDVVSVTSVPQINALLGQQYVANLSDGSTLPPINATVSVIEGISVQFVDVVLGSPLLTFSSTQQQAALTMNFLAGQANVVNTAGTVLASSVITPGDSFTITGTVPLTSVEGVVENSHDVVIDIQNGASFSADLGLSAAASAVLGSYFLTVLQNATGFNYTLGTIVYDANTTNLVPVSFQLATQVDENDPSDLGRLLLFIATQYNQGGGSGPQLSVSSSLIPDGSSTALIVSSKVLFESILAPALQTIGSDTAFSSSQSTSNATYTLQSSGGSIDAGTVQFTGVGDEAIYHYLSSNNPTDNTPSPADVIVPFTGFTAGPASDASGIQFDWSVQWNQGWAAGQSTTRSGWIYSGNYLSMTANLSVVNVGTVDATTDDVSFTATASASVSFPSSSWIDKVFGNGDEADRAGGYIQTAVNEALQTVGSVAVPEIQAFAVTNLLFPESNVLSLSSVYVPGDLVMFGSVESPALQVAPLMVTLASGETQQFTVLPSTASVTWSAVTGSIDSTGLYTAPASIAGSSMDVVTATSTTDSSQTISAAVSLVPSGVLVSPFFAVMTSGLTQQFTAVVAGSGAQTVAWTLVGDGTLTSDGVYAAPAAVSDIELVTIEASGSNLTGNAQVFLLPSAPSSVTVSPPIAAAPLGPSGQQQFTAALGSSSSFTWTTVPGAGAGTVDQTGLYSAPSTIDAPQTVLVVATSTVVSTLFGFGVVNLVPASDC